MSELTKKKKKPVCPTCRSTKWRKNSLGQYVCEGGHVLEGHQEEEGEFAEGHAGYERRLKTPRKKKKEKVPVYHGVEATTLVLRCTQYILQLQAQALVRDLGFPRDITGVIQEYWNVFVSNLVNYHDGRVTMPMREDDGARGDKTEDGQGKEVNTDSETETEGPTAAEFKDKAEPATPVQDLLDTQKEFQQSESETSDDDDDDDDEDNEEGQDSDEDNDLGNKDEGYDESESASSEGNEDNEDTTNVEPYEDYEFRELTDPLLLKKRVRESTDGRLTKRRKGILNNRYRTDYRFLKMRFTVAILYISSQHLKIPVAIGDFQRWIMRHDIPFYNALKLLPKHMEMRLPPTYRVYLTPSTRNPESLRRAVNVLLQHFERLHCIGSILPNTPRLIARFLHDLMLPVECYSCALRFYDIVYDSADTKHERWKLTFRSTLRGPDRAMAVTIVVAKLIFGLYGEKRNVKNWEYWINGLPTEKQWLSSLDSFDALRRQSEIPYMHGEFEELINVNPDLYSEHYRKELKLFETEEQLRLLSVVDKSFKMTGSRGSRRTSVSEEDQQSQLSGGEKSQRPKPKPQTKPLSVSVVPYIQRLCSNVQPANNLAVVEDGRLPQQKFVHYLDDPKGQFLAAMQPPMMTRHHRRIRRAKLRARSELDIFQWDKHQFAQQDFTIPASHDTLERIDYAKVSREEFIERYEEKSLPVVIRGVMEGWGACKNWNSETFLKKYYSQPFKVGEDDDGNNVYVKMKYFLKYAETDGLKDDSPLYIFDSGFVKRKLTAVQKKRISGSSSSSSSSSSDRKSKKKSSSSSSPTMASKRESTSDEDDGDSESEKDKDKDAAVGSKRARSNSLSNGSANKVIRVFGKRASKGREDSSSDRESAKDKSIKREEEHASTLLNDFSVPKYFKDDLFQLAGDRRRPPYRWFVVGGPRSGTGIHIDPLGTSAWNTLTTGHKRWCMFPPGIPKSLYDPVMKPFDREAVSWFHHVYPRFAANDFELAKQYGMIEVIQGPGETMFVPGGWPHIVMNLDFTIAITQNFCSPTNFEAVWLYTRHARPKLAKKFQAEIERMYNKTRRCYFKDLLDKCRSLAYVPMIPMSTDDSSSSSSSSSSDSDDDVTSTDSESDIGEICMCHKCKKKRRKELRRANKEKKSDKSDRSDRSDKRSDKSTDKSD
ncbi:jumonji domain-containing protein 6 [Mortierella sp. GBA39]|nr:jumonji domain-containing protein 6 [Mortierella sp. GBA39]